MKVGLWIGGRKGHPFKKAQKHLSRILKGHDSIELVEYTSQDFLTNSNLTHLRLLVTYTQGGTLSGDEVAALVEFVKSGGAIIGIHGATASFKKNPRYHELLGGKFTGHGLPRKIKVKILDSNHEITMDVDDFTIKDEPYNHDLLEDEIHVLVTRNDKNKQEPMAWTRDFGEGKVIYIAFGHFGKCFKNPNFVKLVNNAINWSLGK